MVHNLYLNCLKQPHLLIGGSTGSGRKIANKGDTIICYSDGTYDVERRKS